jgi:hypothetical protein
MNNPMLWEAVCRLAAIRGSENPLRMMTLNLEVGAYVSRMIQVIGRNASKRKSGH